MLALALSGCAASSPVVLAPDLGKSFAHMGGARICLVGDGWALEACFEPAFPSDQEATRVPTECFFFRGRDIQKYFFPSGGPISPLDAERERLPKSPVIGLKVSGCDRSTVATGSSAVFTFSGFAVEGVSYGPIGPVTIDIRGPFP
ncbi:MAG: hypothetical protein FD180_4318 [Planctomycetota bacterium]|nr:MAG: hypothetical protein FD180_4318 [Planctomycetota bacterium]